MYHFLRDHIEKGDVIFKYVDTKTLIADIF